MSEPLRRCAAVTKAGTPCRLPPLENGYCRRHVPAILRPDPHDPPPDPPIPDPAPSPPDPPASPSFPSGIDGHYFSHHDLKFLAKDPVERLALLQGAAELTAFRAYQVSASSDGVDGPVNAAFNRSASTVVRLMQLRMALAHAAARGLTGPDGQAESDPNLDPEQQDMTHEDRLQALVALLDAATEDEDGEPVGSSLVAAMLFGTDGGPAESS